MMLHCIRISCVDLCRILKWFYFSALFSHWLLRRV